MPTSSSSSGIEDERGFFARIWCKDELSDHGLVAYLSQCSISRNSLAGTLRGMHFQHAPHEEAKFVRCTAARSSTPLSTCVQTQRPTAGGSASSRCRAWKRALRPQKGSPMGSRRSSTERRPVHDLRSLRPRSALGCALGRPGVRNRVADAEARTISERDLAWPDYELESRRSRGV